MSRWLVVRFNGMLRQDLVAAMPTTPDAFAGPTPGSATPWEGTIRGIVRAWHPFGRGLTP